DFLGKNHFFRIHPARSECKPGQLIRIDSTTPFIYTTLCTSAEALGPTSTEIVVSQTEQDDIRTTFTKAASLAGFLAQFLDPSIDISKVEEVSLVVTHAYICELPLSKIYESPGTMSQPCWDVIHSSQTPDSRCAMVSATYRANILVS